MIETCKQLFEVRFVLKSMELVEIHSRILQVFSSQQCKSLTKEV